jgi:hypothetical protein
MLDGTTTSAQLLATLAQQHTSRCIARLATILDGPDATAAAEAARELLDRGYGKPLQPLAFDADGIAVEVNATGEAEARRHRANGRIGPDPC